jgi:hypothetical protein
MYGSTPSGSHSSFSYDRTHTEVEGRRFRISTEIVDEQIPEWLKGLAIDSALLSEIQGTYKSEIKSKTQDDKENQIEKLKKRLSSLETEESRLARLFMAGKINEDVFDQLRQEWQEKVRQVEATLKELEFDASTYLDDLDVALTLLTNISTLYERFKEKKRTELLQVLLRRIIINRNGEIISYELHSPFSSLVSLVANMNNESGQEGGRSTCVMVSSPTGTRTLLC